MYFLTDEERKRLLRGLLPRSREADIAEELRGWNWPNPPLQPVYDTVLALYEVANSYCPTNRDLYLRRVRHIYPPASVVMVQGRVLHAALVHILVNTKRLIYSLGVGRYKEVCGQLQGLAPLGVGEEVKEWEPADAGALRRKVEIVTDFEKSRIVARIQEILFKQPFIGEDSLAALAVPVVVEQRLDGSFLGLSPNLSTDAFTFCEPMIVDLKFGQKRDFHRLTTTGYAMVMESLYEFPVNIGCLVYATFREDRLFITKDLHIIDDELRQWFIEARDDKMRMIYEEIDPGMPDDCHQGCHCYAECHK